MRTLRGQLIAKIHRKQSKLEFFLLCLCSAILRWNRVSIYPHSLKVNLEQTGNTVHFLDLTIKCTNSKKFPFTTDLFDKRTLPKFANLPMTRYPHRSGFVPAHFGLNIVTSQGFRLLRIKMPTKKRFYFPLCQDHHRTSFQRVFKETFV